MTKFERALKIVLKHEGGVSDHAEDPGGFTVKGITLGFLRAFGLDPNNDGVIDKRDLIGRTDKEIAKMYSDNIWRPCRCDELTGGLSLAVFDAAVNLGQTRAVMILQASLGVVVDGGLGPKTMAAVQEADRPALLSEFAARRGLYYATRPKVFIFGLGWFRRLIDIYRRSLTF